VKVKNLNLFPHKKSISTNAQYVTQQNHSDIEVLIMKFFPTPPLKLKLGLQVGGIASRWETTTSNPFEPIKLSTQSETGSSQPIRFGGPISLRVDSLDWTGEPSSKIPSAGSHILSIGGDALNQSFNVASALGIQTLPKTFAYTLITYLVTHSNQLWPQKNKRKLVCQTNFVFIIYFPNLISNPRKECPHNFILFRHSIIDTISHPKKFP
jgi:hypothetical protein